MSQTNSTKKYVQAAALLLFLVGLPLGSWYYLQAGFSYHKDLMKELKTYAQLPEDLNYINHRRFTEKSADLKGKMAVGTFLDVSSSDEAEKLRYLKEMIKQFEDRPELIFLINGLNASEDTPDRFREFARSDELLLNPQVYFLNGDQATNQELLTKVFKEPVLAERKADGSLPLKANLTKTPDAYPYFVFMDSSLTIKNYYDVNNEKSVTRLVEHIAITLPRDSRAKPEVRRNSEK